MSETWKRHLGFKSLFAFLLFVPAALIGVKVFVLGYPLGDLVPEVSYRVDLSMQVDGHGGDVAVSTYLPRSDSRQRVSEEQNSLGPFSMSLLPEGQNRIATWKAEGLVGRHTLLYSFSAAAQHVRYLIPEKMPIPSSYPEALDPYLASEEGIQVEDPLVEQTLKEILPPGPPTIVESLMAIHRFLTDELTNRNFSGFTDALTALKLREASCNGKSRLFAAMARKLNLPTRLVGGLILNPGAKRTIHQWVEVYVNGHWVPFDTLNDHYCEVPPNFLVLYYGDKVLFRHSANVNFQYFFKTLKRLVPRHEVQSHIGASHLNLMDFYALFEKVGISQNLLKIILMLPLGVFVITVLRNVIGLETFGTFLPALIAAASRESGYFWGMVGFVSIILVSALIRQGLDRLQLLHTPKMAIMLTVVIIILLSLAVFGVRLGLFDLAHVTLFPIAILAITAERFALMQTEQGFIKAFRVLGVTVLAVGACYAVMDSLFLQSLILVFPELLLVAIALNLWLGKWIGIRVLEFVRFRWLLQREGA